MKINAEEQDLHLRNYLLGNLSSEEEQLLEEKLLVDDDYQEQMAIVEDELIDDYQAGRLSRDHQVNYEKLFLATRLGQQKLRNSRVIKKHLAAVKFEEKSQESFFERFTLSLVSFFSPAVLTTATALLVVAVSGLSWWLFFQSNPRSGINALKEAYRQERPLEGRITGFPYAQFPGASKSSSRINTARMQAADKAFRDLAGKEQTPAALHAQGKYLLTKKSFDEAVKTLESGSKADPSNAALHIDLAVALLERGKAALSASRSDQASLDFNSSRHHLEEALRLNPSSAEAIFNLALLNQTQKLWNEAENNWLKYLEKDPNSQWSNEARNYLKKAIEAQGR